MKRTIRIIAVIVLLTALAVSITACGGPKKEDIIGHWEVYDRVLNFHPDGTFNMSSSREYASYLESRYYNNDFPLEEARRLAQKYSSDGSWEIYGNTVKTETGQFGFIDFTYEDGKLIDGDDVYTKKD